jgi:hypothetical protein
VIIVDVAGLPTVAVLVDPVRDNLGGTGVNSGVRVVAISGARAHGIAIAIQALVHRAVAIVVLSVAELAHAGKNVRIGVVTIAVTPADAIPIAIRLRHG